MSERLQLLHELLEKDQEAFSLDGYIADRRCKSKKPCCSNSSKPRRRRRVVRQGCCFLPLQSSPGFFSRSPFLEKRRSSSSGFGLFASFMRSFSHRRCDKKRRPVEEEGGGISFSRYSRRLSTAAWIENNVFAEELRGDFDICGGTRFCISPFMFSFQEAPFSSGRSGGATPKFLQGKENCQPNEEEDSSPVSILEPPFDDDDGHGSADAEPIHTHDLEASYDNLQRAKQQILCRISRFEKLAELDSIELEQTLAEDYSDEHEQGGCNFDLNEAFPLQRKAQSSQDRNPITEHDCVAIEFGTTLDTMTGFDLRNGRCELEEEVEEITGEIEFALCILLVQELFLALLHR